MEKSLKSGLSGKLWPVHFKPYDDEIFSSWLTRLSIAHGLSVYNFISASLNMRYSYILLVTDIDKPIRIDLLDFLAEKTGTPIDKVLSTTLASYQGLIYEHNNPKGTNQWILPHFNRQRSFRLQYCPQCLLEDKVSFFRRSWRLAFNVICIKHRIQLLDRCTVCGKAVNYYKASGKEKVEVPLDSIVHCYSCNSDLREVAPDFLCRASQEEVQYQELLIKAIEQRWVNVTDTIQVYALLYFRVLSRLMSFLSSTRLGFREKVSQASGIEMFSISRMDKTKGVEYFNTLDRRRLLDMARWLLSDWPERFIEFCKLNKIGCETLFHKPIDHPFWYWSVVRDDLDGTMYVPSDKEVESAINYYNKIRSQVHYEWYPEKLKAVSSFLNSISSRRRSSLFKSFNRSDMRQKLNWRNSDGNQRKYIGLPKPRYISNSLWKGIGPLIPNIRRQRNSPDDRTVLNGALYVLLAGCTWRKLPAEFGKWQQVYLRFRKWKQMGIFEYVWARCSHLYD